MSTTKVDFRRAFDAVIQSDDFREGAQYYDDYRDRYERVFRNVEEILGGRAGRILDVGGGQYAVLARRLLRGVEADVADIEIQYTKVLAENGVGFVAIDLSSEPLRAAQPYDLAVLSEVIEHVPKPPHLVFRNLAEALVPGGHLLVTTPNLYRLRNLVRLATGRPVFDYFRVPTPDAPLGHFVEYALDQIVWQLGEAGFEIAQAGLVQLSHGGSSTFARISRTLLAPVFAIRPQFRDNILVVARKPA